MMLLSPYLATFDSFEDNKYIPKYQKHKQKLFQFFVDQDSVVWLFVSETYQIENPKGKELDGLVRCKWLIENKPYFSGLGKSIKKIRNLLAHGKPIWLEELKEFCVALSSFKHERKELERLTQDVVTAYADILQLLIGRIHVGNTVGNILPTPDAVNEIHSLGWFKKYCGRTMKGKKMIVLTDKYKDKVLTFDLWNGKNAIFVTDSGERINKRLRSLAHFYIESYNPIYVLPGISIEWLISHTREEILKELNLTIMSGRYESEPAKFLSLSSGSNKVYVILTDLHLKIGLPLDARVSI